MKLTVKCDWCGKEGKGDEFYHSGDGDDLCEKCNIENEINSLQRQIQDKEDWLESTHLKTLKEMKAHVKEKQLQLSKLN